MKSEFKDITIVLRRTMVTTVNDVVVCTFYNNEHKSDFQLPIEALISLHHIENILQLAFHSNFLCHHISLLEEGAKYNLARIKLCMPIYQGKLVKQFTMANS